MLHWLFIIFAFFFFFLQSTIIFFFSIYRKIIWCIFPPVHFMKEIFNLIPVIVMYLLLLVFPSNKLSFGSYQVSYLFIESLIYFLFFLLLFVDLYFFKLKLSWHHLSFVLARVTVQHFKQPDFTVKSVVLNCEQIKTTSERRHQNMRWMFILLSCSLFFFLLDECERMTISFIFLILLCHSTVAHRLRFNYEVWEKWIKGGFISSTTFGNAQDWPVCSGSS